MFSILKQKFKDRITTQVQKHGDQMIRFGLKNPMKNT